MDFSQIYMMLNLFPSASNGVLSVRAGAEFHAGSPPRTNSAADGLLYIFDAQSKVEEQATDEFNKADRVARAPIAQALDSYVRSQVGTLTK